MSMISKRRGVSKRVFLEKEKAPYQRTGYHIGFNGHRSGYLALYETQAGGPM